MVRPRKRPMKRGKLSRQRMAVLVGIANGKSNREMAKAMGVAPATIHSHVSHLLQDLEVHSREHAVALGLKLGFISLRQIVLEGECPGPSLSPNYCRCECESCREGQCSGHSGGQTWLGSNPSDRCRRRLHSHCSDKTCTCGCGHDDSEDNE